MSDDLKRRLILLAACLTAFLVAMDITVINLALPSIQRDLGVSLVERGWALKANTLTFAALVIVGGKLGDIFGRKRFLVIGAALFAVGSLVGFVAADIGTLLTARVIQAAGCAAMMPASLSVLTAAYQNRNMATAIGLWGSIGRPRIHRRPAHWRNLHIATGLAGYLPAEHSGDSDGGDDHSADGGGVPATKP